MKAELMKIEGVYSLGEYVHIEVEDGLEITVDTTDGYVNLSRHGQKVMAFDCATEEEVLNLVKALKR
jgi:hypothetical protein